MLRSILLAFLALASASRASAGAVEDAVSDAIGIFCVPIVIAGKLPADDLIQASHFVASTDDRVEVRNASRFERQSDGGDLVEVFAETAQRRCMIHVHGSIAALDEYRSALRAQNWRQHVAPMPMGGGHMEGWRVEFGRGAGAALHAILSPPDSGDPAKPRIIGIVHPAPR